LAAVVGAWFAGVAPSAGTDGVAITTGTDGEGICTEGRRLGVGTGSGPGSAKNAAPMQPPILGNDHPVAVISNSPPGGRAVAMARPWYFIIKRFGNPIPVSAADMPSIRVLCCGL